MNESVTKGLFISSFEVLLKGLYFLGSFFQMSCPFMVLFREIDSNPMLEIKLPHTNNFHLGGERGATGHNSLLENFYSSRLERAEAGWLWQSADSLCYGWIVGWGKSDARRLTVTVGQYRCCPKVFREGRGGRKPVDQHAWETCGNLLVLFIRKQLTG